MNPNNKNNYLAISDILLMVTMLATDFNEQLEKDASTIIDFIGNSFELDGSDIDELKRVVPNDLTILSTTDDVKAYLADGGSKYYPELSDLLYLKSQSILKIDQLQGMTPENKFIFDYKNLREYHPAIRFKELEGASTFGNADVNRAVALMLAVGIGIEKNVKSAIYRLKQCAYWGDVVSLYYLSYLYKELGQEDNAKLYKDLAGLSDYLLEGRTVLPREIKEQLDKEVIQTYAIISSIKQDIVLANNHKNIDYSFVEVMLSDNVDYYKKIEFINEYTSQRWKEITNSSNDPSKVLGFKVKGDK